MVYRVYVEKKEGLRQEADELLRQAREFLGVTHLEQVRVFNRYDVENLDGALFERAVRTVLSEPQVDDVRTELPQADWLLAVEYLPGQFDQRADSAAQCMQILSCGERPAVRTAKVYALNGALTAEERAALERHLINPVEARRAGLELPQTLAAERREPEDVAVLEGFCAATEEALDEMRASLGLAMDLEDLKFCRSWFRGEGREPTMTELRVIDTYWSDHCRHTTFLTTLDTVEFEDALLQRTWQDYLDTRSALGRTKPVTLMDMGTLAARYLRSTGKLDKLDESEEINACTVKMTVTVDGTPEPWLLLFKNETHNHPTEIEPFGGAATCIGGAIRDPLSGRAYVYAAMRVTGAADPLAPVEQTLPGKLPQRKLVTTAAAGYSSYGNQIGLATGMVDELYHPGYAAKRMEIGAVVAAAPAENVRRERPDPGDQVILLGGRTGRDGCGGATGSSKSHNAHSLETCGAEVQKGNAPEERKLQRLFRNPEATRRIKRCNDFGAGGVSVAVGELADGLDIDLDRVPKKYEGLDGTELAISESQERMAVVVAPEDAEAFLALAAAENLEATVIAFVTETPRLRMRWRGRTIVDISRAFLDSNGAEKHAAAHVAAASLHDAPVTGGFAENYRRLASGLTCCSRRGLAERFDSTIGAGTVLMPFGGRYQQTPIQAMAHKISLERGHTDDCSVMSWDFDPVTSAQSPYHGAYWAVVGSVCKLVASGAAFSDVYLTFQEYFCRLGHDPKRWGLPVAALLGAFAAQKALGVAAIGGKDSMSGSFEQLDVPPTLVSFAVTTEKAENIAGGELKAPGHTLCLLRPELDADGLPVTESLLRNFAAVTSLLRSGAAAAAYTPGPGGTADALLKMALGNRIGAALECGVSMQTLFGPMRGAFVLEMVSGTVGEILGRTTAEPELTWRGERIPLEEFQKCYEDTLEPVYPCNIGMEAEHVPALTAEPAPIAAPALHTARPRVLIPAFPGTNCEYDSARAFADAGAEPEIFVVRNLDADAIARSVEDFAAKLRTAQIVMIPGGFSGGDEPDGSGKFITAFFRSPAIREQVTDLLERRDGLMLGICNGFQALIKLGLVPYGKILDADASFPTLSFNVIGRHQSRLVRTRVCSNRSPWLAGCKPGDVFTVPISHGEGRFLASQETLRALAANGQIATQYAGPDGLPGMDIDINPNGSCWAVEGITSPDGRVFGKMGHSERIGAGLYKNVPGEYDMRIFSSAVRYFKGGL